MKFSVEETVLFYNIILLIGGIGAYFAQYAISPNQRIICRIMIFFIIFIPSALRYNIGTDYSSYIDAYNSNISLMDYEIGFRTIVKCLKMFSFPVLSLFIFTSFLIYAPICFLLKREGYFFKWVLFMLIFYLYSYNAVRNCIALSLLIIAFERYFCGCKLQSYFIYSLACTFHFSLFFFAPLFLLDYININKKYLVLLFGLGLYLLYSNQIFFLLNNSLFFNSKYSVYIGSIQSRETEIGSGIGILLYLIIPIGAFGILYHYKEVKQMILFLLLCYIVSYLLALKIQIFGRLSDLFSIALIFSIPCIINNVSIKKKSVKYIAYTFCLLLFLLFQVQIINNKRNNVSGGHGISPYEMIIG